uniref:Pre-mRNA-splicing factor SYF2 n=1 Tax=Colobus angolensis palliatus TaxID=336983 RepID=A0A2K5JG25_COLAP
MAAVAASEVLVDSAEEGSLTAAAELAAQKREQRLRKFRELHLLRECASRGEDYEKVKLLEISAEDAEKWERKKKRKNPDLGFSDYAAAQLRQYHRLTKQIKPDMETYERLREKQIEKRDKYSRRRPYNDDADIDYINERNAKFNKKAERFYGKYTAEIKQNLERGTAV